MEKEIIMTSTAEELESRKAQIAKEAEDANDNKVLEDLHEEVRNINAELEARKQRAEQAKELRDQIAKGTKPTQIITEIKGEKRKMEKELELRNKPEYIKAYAQYVRTGEAKECRALLTENATTDGQLPVPELVFEAITHSWEKLGLLDLVNKTNLKGNVKIGFEISGDDAVIHEEGDEAPDEEELTTGIVTIVPKNIKKWIKISDEMLDETPEAFLRYVYEELAYKIGKKLENDIITKIASRSATTTSTAVGVPAITKAAGIDTVLTADGEIGDEAGEVVVVLNKKTYVAIKAAAKAANYAADPFEGHRVVFNNSLPAYATATAGEVYMVLGDFGTGYLVNYPAAQDIRIKYDDLTEAEADLVKIVGRLNVGHDIYAPGRFANVKKPS